MRFLGPVPYAEILHYYRGAVALAFTSHLETFGQPMLEAMLAETPIIAADIPTFREIAGDIALYFPPDDSVQLARAVDEVCHERDAAKERVARGRARAAEFSWKRSVDALCEVFDRGARRESSGAPAVEERSMAFRRGRAELLLVLGSLVCLLLIGGHRGDRGPDLLRGGPARQQQEPVRRRMPTGRATATLPTWRRARSARSSTRTNTGSAFRRGAFPKTSARPRRSSSSVIPSAFGPAVEEGDTFAGLLRARFADRRIYNSSVIGYSTPDYRNVIDAFLPRHPEVKAVVLVYCLNDISSASAQNIDRYLKSETENAPKQNLTETLRSFTFLSDANDYLRSRSKLYLFIRHRLLATQTRDWKGLLPLYAEERAADVEQSVRDIAEIAAVLKARAHPVRGRALSVRVSAEEPGRSGDADPAAKTR